MRELKLGEINYFTQNLLKPRIFQLYFATIRNSISLAYSFPFSFVVVEHSSLTGSSLEARSGTSLTNTGGTDLATLLIKYILNLYSSKALLVSCHVKEAS